MRGLPNQVREALDKARESALLAVEIYNKPTAVFRSGAYIILIMLAWGSLLQAIFHKKRVYCFEKHSNGRYVKIDGDKKIWSTEKCVQEYFKDVNDPIRKNLEFLIGLRNRFEHRGYPEIDENLFGECQATLMNFEELLIKEFPKEIPLKHNLVFAIQFSKETPIQQKRSISKNASRNISALKSYITGYRSKITEEQWNSQKFSYRLFLIPKVGNNATKDDIAIEFIKYDPSKPLEMEKLQRLGVLIKDRVVEKERIVPSQEIYKFKPGQVVEHVKRQINKHFTTTLHTSCWKHYSSRPRGKIKHKNEYCLYDEGHKDYVYSQAWIDFLVNELSVEENYKKIQTYENKKVN